MAELVRLRVLVEGDLPTLHRWYQDPALWEHLVGDFHPRDRTDAIGYMRRWLSPSRTEVRLAVTRERDGTLLGLASLSPIDAEAGEAEFHIFLGEAAERGRGYGRAATAATLAHAFDALGLWRLWLRVLLSNTPALKLYAALGFEPDPDTGVTAIKDGAPTPVVTMRVTDAGFRARMGPQGARRSPTR